MICRDRARFSGCTRGTSNDDRAFAEQLDNLQTLAVQQRRMIDTRDLRCWKVSLAREVQVLVVEFGDEIRRGLCARCTDLSPCNCFAYEIRKCSTEVCIHILRNSCKEKDRKLGRRSFNGSGRRYLVVRRTSISGPISQFFFFQSTPLLMSLPVPMR